MKRDEGVSDGKGEWESEICWARVESRGKGGQGEAMKRVRMLYGGEEGGRKKGIRKERREKRYKGQKRECVDWKWKGGERRNERVSRMERRIGRRKEREICT